MEKQKTADGDPLKLVGNRITKALLEYKHENEYLREKLTQVLAENDKLKEILNMDWINEWTIN